MVSTARDLADHRALTEGCGLVDRAGRGRLALTGADRREFLHGQITQDIETLEPGHGRYAALLTHKGKMLSDLRVLDLGDELLLDCERVALQELFNMIRRYKLGARRRAAQAHAGDGRAASLIGPDARRSPAPRRSDAERAHRAREIGEHGVILIATDLGVDVFCDAEPTRGRVRGALLAAGAVEVTEAAAEVAASSPAARATASTSTTP